MNKRMILIGISIVVLISGIIISRGSKFQQPLPEKEKSELEQASRQVNPTSGISASIDKTAKSGVDEIQLTISSPQNNSLVKSQFVVISGQTSPKAEVFINELEVVADSKGFFSAKLMLEEGDNYVVVVATNTDGDTAEEELYVTYESDSE